MSEKFREDPTKHEATPSEQELTEGFVSAKVAEKLSKFEEWGISLDDKDIDKIIKDTEQMVGMIKQYQPNEPVNTEVVMSGKIQEAIVEKLTVKIAAMYDKVLDGLGSDNVTKQTYGYLKGATNFYYKFVDNPTADPDTFVVDKPSALIFRMFKIRKMDLVKGVTQLRHGTETYTFSSVDSFMNIRMKSKDGAFTPYGLDVVE